MVGIRCSTSRVLDQVREGEKVSNLLFCYGEDFRDFPFVLVLRRRISNVVRSGGNGVGGRLSETNKFPGSDF